jgi:HD-like signal output (HDOD) protein
MDSYQVASMMFEEWNFEDALVEALLAVAHPHGEVAMQKSGHILYVVKEAINVKEVLTAESIENAEWFHLDKKAFLEAVDVVKGYIEATHGA